MFEDLEFDATTIGIGLLATTVTCLAGYGAWKGYKSDDRIDGLTSKTKKMEDDICSIKKEQTKLKALVDSIPGLPKQEEKKEEKKEEK